MSFSSVKWPIIVLVIVVTILVISSIQLSDSLVYYYTPSEAYEKYSQLKDKTIKIGGLVQAGSIVKTAKTLEVLFVITDLKGHEIEILYHGVPPDLFKENQGVIAEGSLAKEGRQLIAHTLMVKHSEEYRVAEDAKSTNQKLLEESLFKNKVDSAH